MHEIITDSATLFQLFEEFWSHKAKVVRRDHERKAITAVLYDTFVMESSFYGRYGMYEYGLLLNAWRPWEFLKGAPVSATREDILECYRVHDQYCRSVLPDKYLKAYDQAYCAAEGETEMGVIQQINLWVRGRILAHRRAAESGPQNGGADVSAKEEPAIAQEKKIQAELFERMDWINRWLRERKLGRCNRFNTEKQYVQFDLYDAFTFRYDDRPRLQMGGFIDGVNDIELTAFLGQTPTGTTEAEVIHALEVVSEYCRLRLPDKYLEAYEKSAETWEKFSPAATSRKSSRQDGG